MTSENRLAGTISHVYPSYCPAAVVGFFLSLHSCEAIVEDIGCGRVGILVDGNHITRVFVKDDRRGEGLGCIAMGILEKRVFEGHPCAKVDSSLPVMRTEGIGWVRA